MDNRNNMAQLRYLEEAAIRLTRENFDTGQIEDHHLPVSWNGNYLCRISVTGSVLYRQQNVDASGAQTKLQEVIGIAKSTSEYMTMLERAPQLQANGLEGNYRILADFGDAVKADCRVDEIDSFYSVLKHMEMQTVNVDELNYLAKLLERFNNYEAAQFQAMAHELELFTPNGSSAPVDELNALDGEEVARQLIESGSGTITPYGVVYDNGMKLEQVYRREFPCYYYESNPVTIALTSKTEPEDTERIT